ncbi:hypothetical protein L584_12080 [Pantoea agglomerans Tx10]|uniref:DUF3223 domain-containing protein n=1 Tax=Enterobacter agglomerans TaxID=549 RepID=UPI0003B186BE|nr:DUF3223 domain-containing protein [Pantoea agglomerans]ERM10528.1 hypothetical protein L584_12080 [Pantoea agglomerans Tx10]
MPYSIGNESFKAKSQIIKKTQNIIAESTLGSLLQGENYDFMIALLENHNEWDQKTSNGLLGLTTGKSIHGTTCFYIITKNGNEDISFHHAIKCLQKQEVNK